MERDHAVTTTIDRIMKVLARGGDSATAKGSEIRVATRDTIEQRKMEIPSPFTKRYRVRSH
jgi:hypothetical protein